MQACVLPGPEPGFALVGPLKGDEIEDERQKSASQKAKFEFLSPNFNSLQAVFVIPGPVIPAEWYTLNFLADPGQQGGLQGLAVEGLKEDSFFSNSGRGSSGTSRDIPAHGHITHYYRDILEGEKQRDPNQDNNKHRRFNDGSFNDGSPVEPPGARSGDPTRTTTELYVSTCYETFLKLKKRNKIRNFFSSSLMQQKKHEESSSVLHKNLKDTQNLQEGSSSSNNIDVEKGSHINKKGARIIQKKSLHIKNRDIASYSQRVPIMGRAMDDPPLLAVSSLEPEEEQCTAFVSSWENVVLHPSNYSPEETSINYTRRSPSFVDNTTINNNKKQQASNEYQPVPRTACECENFYKKIFENEDWLYDAQMRRENSEPLSPIEEVALARKLREQLLPKLSTGNDMKILQPISNSSSERSINDAAHLLVRRGEDVREEIIDELSGCSTFELMPSWTAEERLLTPLERREYFELLNSVERD